MCTKRTKARERESVIVADANILHRDRNMYIYIKRERES